VTVFSILCCSNNEGTLGRVLLPSLEGQAEHQLLIHRNTPEDNQPLPVVYNRLAREATGERLLFVHQDMRLSAGALAALETKLASLDESWGPVGITGSAGTTRDGWLHDGSCEPDHYRGFHVGCHTLDECLFGCRCEVFDALDGFREVEELSWHLYAAELCVRAARLGFLNYAVQVMALHVGPHQASALSISTLRSAQAWLAQDAGEPVATSGGVLKVIDRSR
jgi:hypothetical protein